MKQPTLKTERLILRPFTLKDAPRVQELAGAPEIAATTLNIPHPYDDGVAEQWIAMHKENFEQGKLAAFAMVLAGKNELIGSISLVINKNHDFAELGYWVGVPYWNKGYCTEAAREMLRFGFEKLGLNRIHARHVPENPSSGRVMEKIGMTYEGTNRQYMKKHGIYKDLKLYAILRSEFLNIYS
jgi:ribosomal-protein-alanine N-acetyltransferase